MVREPYVQRHDKLDGKNAFIAGLPLSSNPNPEGARTWQFWNDGWIEEARKTEIAREQAARAHREQARRDWAEAEHHARYDAVAGRLEELGIDARQLRDYLAGLP